MKLVLVLIGLSVSALFAGSALAAWQDKQPPKPEIPWELDRDGLRQWTEVDVDCKTCRGEGTQNCVRCKQRSMPVCAECDKEGEAVCRDCGGDGKQYDPLDEMICPFCDGSGLWECPGCNGKGSYGVVGGGRKPQDCGPCDESGSIECGVCKGKRHIAVVKPAGGLAKASNKALADATEDLQETIRNLKEYSPRGVESDDRKEFDKAIKKGKKKLPGLKTLGKLMDGSMKAMRALAQYVGYEEWVANEFRRFRIRSIAYIESQLALIEVCKQRNDFNEAAR